PFRDYRAFATAIRRQAPAPAEVVLFQTEAHALAFRLGRPVAVLVEWDELRARLARPGPHHIVAPPSVASDLRRHPPGVAEVARSHGVAGGEEERPMVHLRSARGKVQRTK